MEPTLPKSRETIPADIMQLPLPLASENAFAELSLPSLPEEKTAGEYPRHQVGSEKWLHIGPGRLFRGLVAESADEALQRGWEQGEDVWQAMRRWGICTVGVGEKFQHDDLTTDKQFTVEIKHPDRTESRPVRSVVDHVNSLAERKELWRRMCSPALELVSMSLTKDGYYLDSQNRLNVNHENVKHDIRQPLEPLTGLGILAAGLWMRYQAKDGERRPFSVMVIENLPGEGTGAFVKKLLLEFAKHAHRDDRGFYEYIQSTPFLSTVVDRICEMNGSSPAGSVRTEPYRQIVVELDPPDALRYFRGDPPPLLVDPLMRGAGEVILTSDIRPYSNIKTALVNGPHAMAAMLGGIFNLRDSFMHRIMDCRHVADFLHRLVRRDILPFIEDDLRKTGLDGEAFADKVIQRFSNPSFDDRVRRVLKDEKAALQKFWDRVAPYIEKGLDRGYLCSHLVRLCAIYIKSEWGGLASLQSRTPPQQEVVNRLLHRFPRVAGDPRFQAELKIAVRVVNRRGPAPLLSYETELKD